jgi:hypothetical protein
MFCSNCGAPSIEHLNYCKHCGANLTSLAGAGAQDSTAKSIETLGWVIAGTTITLLGMALGTLVLIKDGAVDATLGRVVVIMSLVGFVLVEGVLLWRMLRETRKQNDSLPAASLNTRELPSASGRELAEPVPPLSVAEPTTRELEPAYRSKDPISGVSTPDTSR